MSWTPYDLFQTFDNYRTAEFLTDCFIVTADGRLPVHRFVLAAFSEFLNLCIKGSSDEPLELFLMDFRLKELKVLVSFLYGNLKSANVNRELIETLNIPNALAPEEKKKTKEYKVLRQKCPFCVRSFKNLQILKRHEEEKHSDLVNKGTVPKETVNTGHTCETCGKTFHFRRELLSHHASRSVSKDNCVQDENSVKEYKCSSCPMEFFSFRNLRAHVEDQHDKNARLFRCDLCDVSFKHEYLKRDHIGRMHAESFRLQCPKEDCGYKSNLERDMRRHILSHRPTPLHVCELCGKGFKDRRYLKTHMEKHEGINRKPFACQFCGKQFTRKESMKNHERFHSGEKPFRCQECGESFTLRSTFIYHQKCHTDENNFMCDNCGGNFRGRNNLLRHRKNHCGIETFNCQVCSKTFRNGTLLKSHERKHEASKTDAEPSATDPKKTLALDLVEPLNQISDLDYVYVSEDGKILKIDND